MTKRMRIKHFGRIAAVLVTASGLAGCPGGSVGGLNIMGGGELLQGGAMVVGSAVQGIGSVVADGAAMSAAAGTSAADAMETAPVPAGKPDQARERNGAQPPLPYPPRYAAWMVGLEITLRHVPDRTTSPLSST